MPKKLKPAAPAPEKPWFGYVRVSTEEQGREGVSLDAQQAQLEAWAQLKGVQIVVYAEQASGATLDRPVLLDLLARLRNGEGAGLVVVKVDRFSRSLRDSVLTLAELDKAGAAFAAVTQQFDTTTALGRLLMNILLSMAEWELEMIRERTRDGIRELARRGSVYGKVPFGYDGADYDEHGRPRTLIPNLREQQVLKEMREQKERGMTYSAIARALTEAGIRPKYGRTGKWDHSTVRWLLTSDRLCDGAERAG